MPDHFFHKLASMLMVSFLVIFIMIIAASYLTINKLERIGDTFDHVVLQTAPALLSLGQIETNTYFLLLEVNEYVLSPSEEHAAEFKKAKGNLQFALNSYERAEIGEEETILIIKEKMSGLISFGESIIDLKNSETSQEILLENTNRLDELAEEFIEILNKELLRDTSDYISSQVAVSNQVKETLQRIIVLALITLLVTVVAGFIVGLSIMHAIRDQKAKNKPDVSRLTDR